jgi:hypothetical protein
LLVDLPVSADDVMSPAIPTLGQRSGDIFNLPSVKKQAPVSE